MSDSAGEISVALFPIPNVVAFPGTVLPLHVFEPRYRQLIHDCVSDDRMVGVCHTVKTIHQPQKQQARAQTRAQTLEQALSSNQATYKPREVFSAGPCEIVETTSDGRIVAAIRVRQRLTLMDELQSLPYRIVACTALEDTEPPTASTDSKALQASINERLIGLVETQNPELARQLSEPDWASLEPADYSFRIFQFLRFDADAMQGILEMQSAQARLETIWDVLRSA